MSEGADSPQSELIDVVDVQLVAQPAGRRSSIPVKSTVPTADDWLISPEVVGGTTVSFYVYAFDSLYGSYSQSYSFCYSESGTEITDFVVLETKSYKDEAWAKVEFSLPANAKYFAIHVVNYENRVSLMFDDFEFTKGSKPFVVESYNVYRNDELIANVVEPAYADDMTQLDEEVDYRYEVTVVYADYGESMLSNVVILDDLTAVDGIDAAGAKIVVRGNEVTISGCAGNAVAIYSISGYAVYSAPAVDDVKVTLASGVYLVTVGNTTTKIMVN